MTERVTATQKALNLVSLLSKRYGPLLFHQSGSFCDGSAPMCYAVDEFLFGEHDIFLGEIGGLPFYISRSLFEYWNHTQLIVDVVNGRGTGFSLEASEGVRFLTRSRVLTEEELAGLDDVDVARSA